MRIGGRTRVFALLGQPVAHSLSPRMHNAGFLAAGVDAVYVAMPISEDAVAPMIAALVEAGGGGNVTIPFKGAAATLAATRTERVTRSGSANVFAGGGEGILLDNTDVGGILAGLQQLGIGAGCWQLVGTGGSARAVAVAAHEAGARLAVRSRSAERAAEFSRWAASLGVQVAEPGECTVVINATPLGLASGDAIPFDIADLPPGAAVLDLVYRAGQPTEWAVAARARGHRAVDGREVLLAQGIGCWASWFPRVRPPVEIMRAALHGSLG